MRVLSLDPSVNTTGWAIYSPLQKTRKRAWQWGTIKMEGYSLEMRIMSLCQSLDQLACPEGGKAEPFPEFLVTEKPTFFSSERGQVAAHMNYTINLAAINYFVAGWFRIDHRHHFAITATQWKGAISKVVTAKRFFREFPKVEPLSLSEHAVDAVMLCRWAVEHLIANAPLGVRRSSPEDWLSHL